MAKESTEILLESERRGSSPAARGGAGAYIEGELGALYLLVLLTGAEPRGLPGVRLDKVRFQGQEQGFALDDLVLHGTSAGGACVLEIQSKRTVTFAPKDPVFKDICEQVSRTVDVGVDEGRHLLAVATQRTSRAISGPYQDVLLWAQRAASASEFFARLQAKGVGNQDMRDFVQTFRAHLVAFGVADDDDAIWRILRRFLILEFDFEAVASLASVHALLLARQALADEEVSKAGALHSVLIALSLETAKTGGSIDRQGLVDALVQLGFKLAGDRNLRTGRERLVERSQQTLADIGNTVAGVNLPRLEAVAAVDKAMDTGRFVEIRGESGVGKSWVLRHVAERQARESHIIVLDPVSTPEGGWGSFASSLGIDASTQAFLADLAASGGGVLFIDSLEMFTDPRQQRTVNDLLRAAAMVGGFTVVATARPEFGQEGDSWLAADAIDTLGPPQLVTVGALSDAEVDVLREQAPELRALLLPTHPAAAMARNLYRLSRLLKVPDAAALRTEAALAQNWWTTADGAPVAEQRPAQRIMADLADAALKGEATLELRTDSPARSHLLRSPTLREVRRDTLTFYHDVLRDWAVACRIHEDTSLIAGLDLTAPVSPRLARGIELAGRLALERSGCSQWLDLLGRLSPPGAHGSWRRQALMTIVRSELGAGLLEQCAPALLENGAGLFKELATTIIATDTVATADVLRGLQGPAGQVVLPRSLRTNITGTASRLLIWAIGHATDLPLYAIGAVLDLVQAQFLLINATPILAQSVAKMLFGWLGQLDVRDAVRTIPSDSAPGGDRSAFGNLVTELRTWSLFFAGHAPDEAKAYLRAVTPERDHHKVKAIRGFSKTLAPVAAQELADLVVASVIDPETRTSRRRRNQLGREFDFADNDYLPASPAQPPFLDLLEANPQVGLELIRHLTREAIRLHTDGADPGMNGITLKFDAGPRFFPWVNTFLWSRGQCREYSVGSGLNALEAWGHIRLDRGDPIDEVLADILGPDGSCAAYLLVAMDVLISHLGATREALVPFVSSPHLMAFDRSRQSHDQIGTFRLTFRDEPAGTVRLADLAARVSRQVTLYQTLVYYVVDDPVSARVRDRLKTATDALGAYDQTANFSDPAFMGRYGLNMLNPDNWVEHGEDHIYQSPPDEAAHLAGLQRQSTQLTSNMEIDAKVRLAIGDRTRGSVDIAREAVEYAGGALPDEASDEDDTMRLSRLVATAMLVARDGDDETLDAHEAWVRTVIDRVLLKPTDRHDVPSRMDFSPPALAACTLIHLWGRRRKPEDRNRLIELSTRDDQSSVLAFADGLATMLAADERVLKAAMRVAFASCRYRWARWDEDPDQKAAYERERAFVDAKAVAAEVAWLDGGAEPAWPTFPDESPIVRRPTRVRLPAPDDFTEDEMPTRPLRGQATVHVATQSLAKWLNLLTTKPGSDVSWKSEIVGAYAAWSANLNGLGLPVDAELDRRYDDWDDAFYVILAVLLMDMAQARFQAEVDRITGLPDGAFCNVAASLLQAADATYFNQPARAPDRVVALRHILTERAKALEGWDWHRPPGDTSIDHDTGEILAKLLLNTYDFINGTRSYLVPFVAGRLDPLLVPMQSLMSGGPTSFIALCTMNLLLVSPLARHMEFLLSSVEAWLERPGHDATMWLEVGIGTKVTDWFDKVIVEDPSILGPDHPLRGRIDAALGRLVDLGVPQAHELLVRIEREATATHA